MNGQPIHWTGEKFSIQFKALPPLGLYIHIPWCVKKCPYCDFNSHEVRGPLSEKAYVEALLADFEQALPKIWGRRISSIFFGGGTPSLFSAESIDDILCGVRARLPVNPGAEVSLEANPGTLEKGRFKAYRDAGVNRLSLGIQSFNPKFLKQLGRIHDGEEARKAVLAAASCFDNFNLDLMYGLPGQTPKEAIEDFKVALSFEPKHLSAYHLTIEPNTYFHRFPPALPDEDVAEQMQTEIELLAQSCGYDNYETSAFAKPDSRCQHNMNYWTFGDYVGIGAGAHGKISYPDSIERETRYRQPKQYIEKALGGGALEQSQSISAREVGFEFMMNALRLQGGFDVALFADRTGLSIANLRQPLALAEARGFILRDHLRVTPTHLGRRFLNDLLQIFLPEKKS